MTINREELGRLVRTVWIAWAKEQPVVKPSWLVPWEGLAEPDREVDRRIGEAIVARERARVAPLLARLEEFLVAENPKEFSEVDALVHMIRGHRG